MAGCNLNFSHLDAGSKVSFFGTLKYSIASFSLFDQFWHTGYLYKAKCNIVKMIKVKLKIMLNDKIIY